MKIDKFVCSLMVGAGLFGGTLASAQAQTVKIGIVVPLTGPAAPWGNAAKVGIQILANDINAKGGLEAGGKKYPIEVIAYDDQYKASEAIAAYNRLTTRDGVKELILQGSPQSNALKQMVEDDQVLTFTTAAAGNIIDAKSHYMFRATSVPAQFVPPFVKWMKENMTERRVAIMNPNQDGAWDQTELALKYFKENGFTVVDSELFEPGMKDFAPILTKVLATKPEIIELAAVAPASAGLLIRQARELGYKGKFTKNSGPAPQEILDAAGKDAAEGMLMLFYGNTGSPGYTHLASEYKKIVGQEPNQLIVSFYDAANIMLAAMQKAGDPMDTPKVRDAVQQVLPMDSVQGGPLKLGGKALYGVDQQVDTVGYVAVMKDGHAEVVGHL
jgi:branched-chain amino acid transport system substrate-binding protein